MSTTTQILFNSPALHSLRRDQLVGLCKRHGLRAQGRNEELIHRLEQHAEALLSGTAQSPTTPSDEDEGKNHDDDNDNAMNISQSRPSEQWELMDTITEVDEPSSHMGSCSSLRSNRSGAAGEFGTVSSKCSSVTSSIRALASSFGISRKSSKSKMRSLTRSASTPTFPSPFSTLPPLVPVPEPEKATAARAPGPTTSYSTPPPSPPATSATFEFFGAGTGRRDSLSAPVPGHARRPGRPAPFNARLSLGLDDGATTTIRLIPSTSNTNMSPPRLAPYDTTLDLLPASPGLPVWPPASPVKGAASPGGDASDRLYPSLASVMRGDVLTVAESAADEDMDMPGAFDASNALSAAAPVTTSTTTMDASNASKSLSPRSPKPFIFGSPSPKHRVSNAQFEVAASSVLEEMNKRLGLSGNQALGLDILKNKGSGTMVEEKKEDSMGLGVKEKFDKVHEKEFEKMDSIASYAAKRGLGAKRKSSVLEDGTMAAPGTSRPKGPARVISAGTRKKMGVGIDEVNEEGERPSPAKRQKVAEEKEMGKGEASKDGRKEKEREAMKKKLALNTARRRSGRGMVNVGTPKAASKASPSKFGLFSAAKSMVKNAWNKSAASKSSAPASTKPSAPAPTKPSIPKAGSAASKVAPSTTTSKPAASTVASKASSALTSSVSSSSSRSSSTSIRTASTSISSAASSKPSTRLRPPIPNFAAPTTASASNAKARATTLPKGSSLGPKTSADSLGVKTSAPAKPAAITGANRSSRLYAPTASSLAKQSAVPRPAASTAAASSHARKPSGPLSQSDKPNQAAQLLSSKALTKSATPAGGSHIPTAAPVLSSSPSAAEKKTGSAGLIPRKPRVSRSRVIAKLGAVPSTPTGRKRISAAVGRSGGAGRKAAATSADILASAKKRARKSEIARRKRQMSPVKVAMTGSMDVEA